MRRKSEIFPLKWNFSFTKRTLWTEEKHQRWNKRPSYSLKRQVFSSFCLQHCCPQFAGFRLFFSWSVDTPFNWILLQSFIFKSYSIFFHLRKYMISRNSPANKNHAALSRVRLFVEAEKLCPRSRRCWSLFCHEISLPKTCTTSCF